MLSGEPDDEQARQHLVAALRVHRQWVCLHHGGDLPRELSVLLARLTDRNRQGPTNVDGVAPDPDGVAMTIKQAARRLNVSTRTVERLIVDGKLASSLVLGCRRIPTTAVDALAGGAA